MLTSSLTDGMKSLVTPKMKKTMNKIKKIWFDGEWLYGLGDDGKTYRQSLLWYKNLLHASEAERQEYEISTIGIHWSKLDEDVSFESFEYEEAEPSAFQRFFLEHPEINVAEFAKGIGLNPSLLRNYINGFKKPSKEREKLILDRIHELGRIYLDVAFAS